MRNEENKNQEDPNVKVHSTFKRFKQSEIDAQIKAAQQEAPPATVGADGEIADTKIQIEKVEATQGTHAIRWLEQEGMVRVFVKELVYEPKRKTGNKFLRKVFLIVFAMILVTAGFNILVIIILKKHWLFKDYCGTTLLYSLLAVLFVNYFWMCSTWSRKKPCNIIGLILGVPVMCFFTAALSSYYSIQFPVLLVFIALGITILICLSFSASNFDFTQTYIFFVSIGASCACVIPLALFTAIFQKPSISTLLIEVFAAVAAVVIILSELQLMLTGTYVDLLENDHYVVAWLIYSSFFTFFIKLLQMVDLIDTD